ncbi:MAG: flavodoxin domain-containing protein [Tissierellia bacterium]|nr:flavodoxin domain-containing protein [Tissierellia bacterium]
MEKILVSYQSKYGTTKRYAEWIAAELGTVARERGSISTTEIADYDVIIHGGGLYAGSVLGIDIFKDHFEESNGKKRILFTCGLGDPEEPNSLARLEEGLVQVLGEDILAELKVFHLRGGIDYSKLSFLHKGMMRLLHLFINRKQKGEQGDEDWSMLGSYGQNIDHTDRATIQPLVDYVRGC